MDQPSFKNIFAMLLFSCVVQASLAHHIHIFPEYFHDAKTSTRHQHNKDHSLRIHHCTTCCKVCSNFQFTNTWLEDYWIFDCINEITLIHRMLLEIGYSFIPKKPPRSIGSIYVS